MYKRLGIFISLLIAVSITAFFVHSQLVADSDVTLSFGLHKVYVFNVIACVFICLAAEVLNQKLPSQVGYAYLATVFVKMGVFVLVFQQTVFSETGFEMIDRYSMVVPTMLFLIIEAIYCGKLMNAQ